MRDNRQGTERIGTRIDSAMRRILFSFLIASACFSVTAEYAAAASSMHLTASGCSVSNVGYLSDLARDYEKETGVKVLVRGGGSMLGLEDLRSGKVDFAASCRAKAAGDPEDLEFREVAKDALVFIVDRTNPVGSISVDEVRAIYAGRITDWSGIRGGKPGAIRIFVSRPQKGLSGVESSTKYMVLGGKDPAKTPNTLFLASTGIVEQMVEKTPGGFATTGFSSARKRDVRMLKVGRVTPIKESIASGKYPFVRPLFLVVPKKAGPETKRFIDFALSRKGQKLISSYGVVPIADVR